MKLFQLVVVSLGALMVAACSGGGSRSIKGEQCPKSYNPFPVEAPKNPNQKTVSMKASDNQLPVGLYDYVRGDLYYVNKSNGLQIHVVESKQRDGKFKGTIACVRNASAGFNNLAIGSEGVSKITVQPDHTTVAESKQYSFTAINSKGISVDVVGAAQDLTSPHLAYEGKVVSSIMIQTGDDFEIRALTLTADGTGTYYVSTKLRRRNLPPTAPIVTPANP